MSSMAAVSPMLLVVLTTSLITSRGVAVFGPSTVLGAGAQAAAPPQRVTVELLKSLKSTSNDPAGDAFTGTRAERSALVDAIVADSSLVSPTYLFLASKTAFSLGRLDDAAFLFYAAQLRTAFDFERYDIASRADGNNAATYLGFLRQTIGEIVNPAIMREPALFTAVMDRLDRWEMVPSAQAYYPDFAEAKGFKVPPDRWAASAATIKAGFMTQFGRRQATLLNDAEYFPAFRFVQAMNLGEETATPENRARYQTSLAAMSAAEARLFPKPAGGGRGASANAPAAPSPPPSTPPPPPTAAPANATANRPAPIRVGSGIHEAKVVKRVEPIFPAGAKGSVILEVTIGSEGTVTDVRVLRNEAALEAAAVSAVRQWRFEPVRLDGRPCP